MATAVSSPEQQAEGAEKSRWRWLAGLALATFLVLALGAVEGWCGRTDSGDVYGSDAVQYLDVARAFERGDFHSALNPLWSQGYPALLAVVRPLFSAGPEGDWAATRWLNFGVFCFSWLCFAWFIREVTRGRERAAMIWVGAVAVFVTAQVCVDQVSRVGPDQLVAAIFFLVCGLVLRILRTQKAACGSALGFALGVGFLVKAVFLPLGCVILAITAAATWFSARRVRETLIAGVLFAAIALGYGAALSRAVGRPTLGESGALNYAWHVNRLAKWVHWQGGNDPAAKAWPKPWIARFAQWDTNPPDFGAPLHPSLRVGSAPMGFGLTIYEFHAPMRATYVPYFDPDYWYYGYRHIVRWRYQVVALGKSIGDLSLVLAKQPLVWAFGFVLTWACWRRESRSRIVRELQDLWPVVAIAVLGVAIYLPVHLEGRYLAGFLAVIAIAALAGITTLPRRDLTRAFAILLLGFVAGLARDQGGIWARAAHHWSPRENAEWRAANGIRRLGLPPGTEVGVIAWTANLHCDWAYMSGLQITSEIATPQDEAAFWRLAPDGQAKVLAEFRRAGARAVFTWDKPRDLPPGWQQVPAAPMWFYRL